MNGCREVYAVIGSSEVLKCGKKGGHEGRCSWKIPLDGTVTVGELQATLSSMPEGSTCFRFPMNDREVVDSLLSELDKANARIKELGG